MSGFRALVLHETEAGKVEPRLEALPEEALPAAGDVTVAVEHSTLNYKDGMVLQGIGRLVRKYPHVPGIDFAGTVERSDVAAASAPATRSCSPAGGSASCTGAATRRRPGSAPTGW